MPRKSDHTPAPQFRRRDASEVKGEGDVEEVVEIEDAQDAKDAKEDAADEEHPFMSADPEDVPKDAASEVKGENDVEEPIAETDPTLPPATPGSESEETAELEEDEVIEESEEVSLKPKKEKKQKPQKKPKKKKKQETKKSEKKGKKETKSKKKAQTKPKKKTSQVQKPEKKKSKKEEKGFFSALSGLVWGSSPAKKAPSKAKKTAVSKAKMKKTSTAKTQVKKATVKKVKEKKVSTKAKKLTTKKAVAKKVTKKIKKTKIQKQKANKIQAKAKKSETKAQKKTKSKPKTTVEVKKKAKKSSLLAFLSKPIVFRKSKPPARRSLPKADEGGKKKTEKPLPKKGTVKSTALKPSATKKAKSTHLMKVDVNVDELDEPEKEDVQVAQDAQDSQGAKDSQESEELEEVVLQEEVLDAEIEGQSEEPEQKQGPQEPENELQPFLLQSSGRPVSPTRGAKSKAKKEKKRGLLSSLLMAKIPAPKFVNSGMRMVTGGIFSEAVETPGVSQRRKPKKAARARKARKGEKKRGAMSSLLMAEIPAPRVVDAGMRAVTGGFFSQAGETFPKKSRKKSVKKVVREVIEEPEIEIEDSVEEMQEEKEDNGRKTKTKSKKGKVKIKREVEEIEDLEIMKSEKTDHKKKDRKEEEVDEADDDASPQEEQVITLTVRKHKKRSGIRGILMSINYMGMGKHRSLFVQNIAMMLNAGLPLIEALETYQKELRNRAMRKVVMKILDAVESGHPFWRAMEDQYLFSPYEIALVRVGEEAGSLAKNMEYLSEQQEKDRSLRQKVKMAMIYPSIVLVLMFVVVVGLGMFVLPNLVQVLYSLNADLPASTRVVIAATDFFAAHGKTVVPGVMLGFIVFLFLAKYTPFRIVAQWMVFKIPGIGRLAKEASIARFGVVLGGLLEAGVPLVESLQSLEEVTTMHSYKRLYGKLVDRIAIGDSFAVVFKDLKRSRKLIPISMQQLVITGERSGSLAKTFHNVAKIYETKAEESAKKLPVILEPMLLLLIGGLVGFIAFSIIVPIYTAVGSVSGAG